MARAVVLARAPRAVKGAIALVTHAAAVDALAVARAHQTVDGRQQRSGSVAQHTIPPAGRVERPSLDLLGGASAASIGRGRALILEAQPTDGARLLVAPLAAEALVASACAVAAMAVRAALDSARAQRAAGREASKAGSARARTIVAELARAAVANAPPLRAVGTRPAVVALARVPSAGAASGAALGAERNLTRRAGVPAGAQARAFDAGAVDAAAWRWTRS